MKWDLKTRLLWEKYELGDGYCLLHTMLWIARLILLSVEGRAYFEFWLPFAPPQTGPELGGTCRGMGAYWNDERYRFEGKNPFRLS